MMPKYYLICLVLLLPSFLVAQEERTDIQLLLQTVENYFDGYVDRDLEKLNKAFDTENGAMKVVSKTEAGEERCQNKFFKTLIPKWASRKKLSPEEKKNCKLTILNLEIIANKLAIATIEMKVGEIIYLDVLSVQKLNEQWKITNKMFVVK